MEASKPFHAKLGFAALEGIHGQNGLILKNGDHGIGMFKDTLEIAILDFKSGWNSDARSVDEFTDVRELQREFKQVGIKRRSAKAMQGLPSRQSSRLPLPIAQPFSSISTACPP